MPSPARPLDALRGRAGVALLVVAALVVVGAVAVGVLRGTTSLFGGPSGVCVAEVDGHAVELSADQAENAATIVAVAVQRGLPARAASIALATAYQESDLHNLDHGDRDSLGLFQQRPSQGWGTPEQVQDPVYAANAFYDALLDVDAYESLEITVAAQEVQRSAFATAYADHEADARVLASALTGNSPAAFTCQVQPPDLAAQAEGDDGLTPRAREARDFVEKAFGGQRTGGYAPGGISTGHIDGSAHYDGRAVDFFFRPVTEDRQRLGWAVAQYAVANARQLAVRTVIYDGRIWTARRSGEGWREYRVPERGGDPDVLAHRDHVHVDVA